MCSIVFLLFNYYIKAVKYYPETKTELVNDLKSGKCTIFRPDTNTHVITIFIVLYRIIYLIIG